MKIRKEALRKREKEQVTGHLLGNKLQKMDLHLLQIPPLLSQNPQTYNAQHLKLNSQIGLITVLEVLWLWSVTKCWQMKRSSLIHGIKHETWKFEHRPQSPADVWFNTDLFPSMNSWVFQKNANQSGCPNKMMLSEDGDGAGAEGNNQKPLFVFLLRRNQSEADWLQWKISSFSGICLQMKDLFLFNQKHTHTQTDLALCSTFTVETYIRHSSSVL